MSNVLDRLAREYLHSIDHGLGKPRPGDFTTMKKLQKDLLKEQDENLGGDREDMGKKWAAEALTPVILPDNYATDRLFETSDLYLDMCEADDEVTVERFDMTSERHPIVLPSGIHAVEHFYTARMVYHINIEQHLSDRGTPMEAADSAAQALDNAVPQFQEYIDIHGPQSLLGKWLPGDTTDDNYELKWHVNSVGNVAVGMLDVEILISERWTDAE